MDECNADLRYTIFREGERADVFFEWAIDARYTASYPAFPNTMKEKGCVIKIVIGIDVSKGKSMVAGILFSRKLVIKPYEVLHTSYSLKQLVKKLKVLRTEMDGEIRIVMEATGHYHEPIAMILDEAKFFVSIVNPALVKDFGNNTLRTLKTDKADAVKIARYGMHYWHELRQYIPAYPMRIQLKAYSRQLDFYTNEKKALEGNLIGLLDRAFPDIYEALGNWHVKSNGHMRWVDFVAVFWHCNCVSEMDEEAFVEYYHVWCDENGYAFHPKTAALIYENSFGRVASLEKDRQTELFITEAAKQLTNMSRSVEVLRKKLLDVARQLPEYPAVMGLYGAGKTVAAQLMAEIGDVRKFTSGKALVAFAGLDPGQDQSGKRESPSVSISKHGSPALRKSLYQAVNTHVRLKPAAEPIYQFYNKKRIEGKHYYVCTTAAANKFLRIYYARVKEYLERRDVDAIATK
jgi:transposase